MGSQMIATIVCNNTFIAGLIVYPFAGYLTNYGNNAMQAFKRSADCAQNRQEILTFCSPHHRYNPVI